MKYKRENLVSIEYTPDSNLEVYGVRVVKLDDVKSERFSTDLKKGIWSEGLHRYNPIGSARSLMNVHAPLNLREGVIAVIPKDDKNKIEKIKEEAMKPPYPIEWDGPGYKQMKEQIL